MPTVTPIMYSPEVVRRVLDDLPSIAALIPDPAVEGVPSDAFPSVLRKTHRELYRWIANTHYEHLADAVEHLERVHAAGCRFGNLLTTRDREQFVSHTGEMFVADDLLRRGYRVKTIERSADVSPDLHVMWDGIDVAVEVYSPRELLAVDAWLHDVSDLLTYADDTPSFHWRVETMFEQTFPPSRAQRDPWAPAKMLAQTRADVFSSIRKDVEASLRKLAPLSRTYPHGDTPLLTTVALHELAVVARDRPIRRGTFSYPGFSGYSPAGVFRTIVERSQRKARRRQVEGVQATARALVVYLMGTKIADDLVHPAHLSGAEKAAREIEPRDYGLDAIAFVVRALPQGLAAILTVADDAQLPFEAVEAMFHQRPDPRDKSDSISSGS